MLRALGLLDAEVSDITGGRASNPYTAVPGRYAGRGFAVGSTTFRIEAGYRAIKFGWEPMGQTEALDLKLVSGARAGVGDDAVLLIDAGCVWDSRTALQRAHAFAQYKIGWLEEPLRPGDVEGYAWLRDRSPVPIAAGEAECGRESFRPLIDRHALDVYQVDLSRCGFTDAAYLRARVEEIGARLCNHCYTSPVTVAASLHWLATCRDATDSFRVIVPREAVGERCELMHNVFLLDIDIDLADVVDVKQVVRYLEDLPSTLP